jgi:osmotically-inducible protein OsmY
MNSHTELKGELCSHRRGRWVKKPDNRRVADSQLAAAAVDAIECLTTVPLESIKVSTHYGWLHLQGSVNYESQRSTIEDVTRHLPGVLGLTDTITIRPFGAPVQAVV